MHKLVINRRQASSTGACAVGRRQGRIVIWRFRHWQGQNGSSSGSSWQDWWWSWWCLWWWWRRNDTEAMTAEFAKAGKKRQYRIVVCKVILVAPTLLFAAIVVLGVAHVNVRANELNFSHAQLAVQQVQETAVEFHQLRTGTFGQCAPNVTEERSWRRIYKARSTSECRHHK